MYEGAEFTRSDQESPSKKSMANAGCWPKLRPTALTPFGD